MAYRPIVMGLHGDPSVGKTTTLLTAGNILLLDFDMGADRAGIANDPYPIHSWEDAIALLDDPILDDVDSIGIDTAKTCLDNFLAEYCMKLDYKNKRGNVLSLQGYGALGNEFKTWLNRIRQKGKDVFWDAHTKDEKDGDNIVKTPNITGGSYDLMMQCSDQVGYMTTQQGKRVIKFGVHEAYRSKDSAYLGTVNVPAIKQPAHGLFLFDLAEKVKGSLADRTKKAVSRGAVWQGIKTRFNAAQDGEQLTAAMNDFAAETSFTDADKQYARNQVMIRAGQLSVKFNKESSKFESTEPQAV